MSAACNAAWIRLRLLPRRATPARGRISLVARVAVLLVLPPTTARAQSLLDRPPDLDVSWVPTPGALQFDFLHRFTVGPAPERKVSNTPTFLLGAGLPANLMVGFNYATNSDVAPLYPNEWEFFGRWRPVSEDAGGPLDAAVQGGYNVAARSFDGALSVGRVFGPLRLVVEPRAFSHAYFQDRARAALAGGAVLRLDRWLALAADAARLLGSGGERTAWGVGIQIAIPYTPHTLSLQATNANTGTLEGASRGTDRRRYGFAFTIPLTLARWFGRKAPATQAAQPPTPPAPSAVGRTPAAAPERSDSSTALSPTDSARAGAMPAVAGAATPPAGGAAPASPSAGGGRTAVPAAARAPRRAKSTARVTIHNLAYAPVDITVAAGGTVTWINRDPLPHSVTADDGSFDSGSIAPGASWSHRFTRPGRVRFHCTPHPFMHGAVVVQ